MKLSELSEGKSFCGVTVIKSGPGVVPGLSGPNVDFAPVCPTNVDGPEARPNLSTELREL